MRLADLGELESVVLSAVAVVVLRSYRKPLPLWQCAWRALLAAEAEN